VFANSIGSLIHLEFAIGTTSLVTSSVLLLILVSLERATRLQVAYARDQARVLAAEKQATLAQLTLLEAQVEPHLARSRPQVVANRSCLVTRSMGMTRKTNAATSIIAEAFTTNAAALKSRGSRLGKEPHLGGVETVKKLDAEPVHSRIDVIAERRTNVGSCGDNRDVEVRVGNRRGQISRGKLVRMRRIDRHAFARTEIVQGPTYRIKPAIGNGLSRDGN
jgi:hypothetical protein